MAGEIKTKLVLDGEKEYKNALNEAYSSLRVLRSELKAETAEMGKNASAQEKASKKAESLKKQIKEQEKIVETLRKALEEAKVKYADNQEAQDKWAEKLNNARTVLANMKNQLETTNQAVSGFNDTMADIDGETGHAVQGVVDLGDAFESLKSVASSVADIVSDDFSGMVENIEAAAQGAWDLMSQAMSAAHDWKGIQEMYGGDLASIEKYFGIAAYGGTDSGTLVGAINKLIARTHNGDEELFAILGEWRMSESQYSNHWDYFAGIIDTIAEKSTIDGVVNESTARDLAAAIFGEKQASAIAGMISNWSEGVQNYNDYVENTGIGLTSDEIKELDDTWQKINDIEVTWNKLREYVGKKLMLRIGLGEGAEGVQKILNDIAMLFTGDNPDAVTKQLTLDVSALVDWASSGIGSLSSWLTEIETALNTSDDSFMQSLSDIVGTARDFLNWILENKQTIIDALKIWLDFKAKDFEVKLSTGLSLEEWGTHLSNIAGDISKLLFIINGSKLFGGGASATAANAAAGTAGFALPAWLSGIVTSGTNLIQSIGGVGSIFAVDWLKNYIPKFLDGSYIAEVNRQKEETGALNPVETWAYVRKNYLANPIDDFLGSIFTNQDVVNTAAEYMAQSMQGSDKQYDAWGVEIPGTDAEIKATNDLTSALRDNEREQSTFFERISAGVARSINGAKVEMDGREVGFIVLPYINEGMARQMYP